MKNLRPIFFAGTGSDVGKSIINAGFCRIFKQDGYRPAPFKAQNMSLNSDATVDGYEIGRAQAVQAEAAQVEGHTDMNPVLLKPTEDTVAQVVLNGKPLVTQTAMEYFTNDNTALFNEVKQAFDRLQARYSPIVMEGAGSISELNLKERDITNMRIAAHADAAVYLVADIDKGGVFASVYGTIALLSKEERALVKGIIINKFRGDIRLFAEGRKTLEELCGIPVVGVVPFYKNIHIEEEDSVSLENKSIASDEGKINVAVVLLRRMSNFTDFNVLERDPRVHLYFTNNTDEIKKADIVILPGSKNTISDLMELRKNGCAEAVIEASREGKTVIGICGGYQMMGEMINDPHEIEGSVQSFPGLGLLPAETTISKEKITQKAHFTFRDQQAHCTGYEIHMGHTKALKAKQHCCNIHAPEQRQDGIWINDKLWGSYIHGILDNPTVLDALLAPYSDRLQESTSFDYAAFKDEQYNKLADHIRQYIDMEQVYKAMELE